jgi:hypothetical protein
MRALRVVVLAQFLLMADPNSQLSLGCEVAQMASALSGALGRGDLEQ